MEDERGFYERLSQKGVSRRDFMKYCGFLTATMGLSSSFVPKVAEVFAAPKTRPPVVWLHFAECTGCSESLLRAMYPWIDELVLEILSIEYHETIMAANVCLYLPTIHLDVPSIRCNMGFADRKDL